MRLIDADAMNEELFYKQVGGKDSLITAESAFEMINAQPTAYDVDAVVKQLEKRRMDALRRLNENKGTAFGSASEWVYNAWNDAIEIVKGGSKKIIKNESED